MIVLNVIVSTPWMEARRSRLLTAGVDARQLDAAALLMRHIIGFAGGGLPFQGFIDASSEYPRHETDAKYERPIGMSHCNCPTGAPLRLIPINVSSGFAAYPWAKKRP
ncbi:MULTISPECIES: hypothetical protein [unclassified Mesorhizobium]|uniref:hypothetical protein n=1 Tax=unclassified Mesorhizobium TaxID=325217 RepID=UPI0013E38E3F|nr:MULTISPECIES: hypothetical protein [unclassified Mesorhizobium]